MCKTSYRFEIEKDGKVISRHYSIKSTYEYCLGFANYPEDVYICEYHATKLHYAWTLKAFINYYKKISK